MAKRKGSGELAGTIAAKQKAMKAAAPRGVVGGSSSKRKAPAPIVSSGYWLLKPDPSLVA